MVQRASIVTVQSTEDVCRRRPRSYAEGDVSDHELDSIAPATLSRESNRNSNNELFLECRIVILRIFETIGISILETS